MSVLMSASQAKELAAAMRRVGPGLVRIGVREGSPYVEHKSPQGQWTVLKHLQPPHIADEEPDQVA